MSYAIHEPVLHPTPIPKLRPTQMTVGLREVALKRKAWAARGGKKADGFLAHHLAPVVIGPSERSFLVDHHHLVRALHDEGLESVFVVIVADLRKLDLETFWNVMEFHGWAHPYDANGKRRDFADLPKTVEDLVDDPYRSLAGELRSAGGFAKDTTPFSEFLWADFLRPRIKAKELRKDFDTALEHATTLAKTEDASYLPGWCAPHVKPAQVAKTAAAKKPAAAKGAAGKEASGKSAKHKDEAKLRRGAAPPAAD
ncbi:MAG: chromosome partitioning protein ParB [Bradyrhizobium sp.]|nr:MAG: chromosome partitioning protein ParB [Bradyrhizobium sp.]